MTRSTQDAAIMLHAIAGRDPHDPTALLDPVPELLQESTRGIRGVRIGVDEHYITHNVDATLAEAVLAGIRVLEHRGATLVPVQVPDLTPYLAAWPTLCTAEAVAAHSSTYPSQRHQYGPWFRGWLDLGAAVSGADYARANDLRAACNGRLRAVWQDIDVLACPAMPTPPFPVTPEALYGPMPDTNFDMARLRFTAPFNFNGAPTLSVPCGLSRDGLPLCLQLVGRPLGESLLCRLGYAYEQETEWHTLHPPVD
jgi:amidase